MSYIVSVREESSKFDLLIASRLQRIEELKKRLKDAITIEDERELLKTLSQEMREILYLQEKNFRNS